MKCAFHLNEFFYIIFWLSRLDLSAKHVLEVEDVFFKNPFKKGTILQRGRGVDLI